MRSILRLGSVVLLLGGAFDVRATAAEANKSIYCSIYSYPECQAGVCCIIRCVYCEQVETGVLLSENCMETGCWGGVV